MSNEQVMSGLVEPQGLAEEPLFYFTRVYLLFFQGLFRQFPEGSYRWSDDEKLSEIAITDQCPIPRDRIEQRPAIVTMRGGAQFANLTLDQMRHVDAHTGMKERTDLVACTMSLNCIAKHGLEAQRVGWIVMSHLRRFKELLQKTGRFHKIGDDVSISPESPPGAMVQGEGDSEFVMVTVQSPFYFQWTEQVTPADAVMLRSVEVHMRSALLPAQTEPGKQANRIALSAPTIRGRVIQPEAQTGHQRVGEITQSVKT
jgi:hypothetical protein